MIYNDLYKGEHFITTGFTLYRKTDDGHVVVQSVDDEKIRKILPDTPVTVVNPLDWYTDHFRMGSGMWKRKL